MVSPCIWCGSTIFEPSIEHVLPDSLGCPPDFVLRDCVCRPCNNGLAVIDQALLKQFEIMTFIKGVRRKKGRAPTVEAWPSVRGRHKNGRPELSINAGPGNVDAWGKALKPARASHGIADLQFERVDHLGKVSFSQTFGDDPKFIRAIYKVAISSFVYHMGPELVRQTKFDAARNFVTAGGGRFEAILINRAGSNLHEFGPPATNDDRSGWVVSFTIFGIQFITDLCHGQKALAKMTSMLVMEAHSNWTKLPLR